MEILKLNNIIELYIKNIVITKLRKNKITNTIYNSNSLDNTLS